MNALNEGWDVLNLYDIIHFDISESKKVSLQDIQLIGRGARYRPYELPKEYRGDDGGIFARNLQFDKYRRKFDNDQNDTGRALETFVYHFVKTGTFLDTLREELLGEGIINEGVERKIISMKQRFLESETYKKGFVLVNQTEKRKKTTGDDIDTTFRRIIKASTYNLRSGGLSDREQNQMIASQHTKEIHITEEFFSRPIIYKALMSSENDFFRFDNLHTEYPGSEIYAIRNELDYWLFGFDGRRFSPDYLLIINDVMNKKMYYQCLIEPKGGHLLQQDQWKEDSLIMVNDSSEVVFDENEDDKKRYKEYLQEIKARGHQEIKNIGLKFFNTNPRTPEDFALDFEDKLYKK